MVLIYTVLDDIVPPPFVLQVLYIIVPGSYNMVYKIVPGSII